MLQANKKVHMGVNMCYICVNVCPFVDFLSLSLLLPLGRLCKTRQKPKAKSVGRIEIFIVHEH